jgi:hypothetical protein
MAFWFHLPPGSVTLIMSSLAPISLPVSPAGLIYNFLYRMYWYLCQSLTDMHSGFHLITAPDWTRMSLELSWLPYLYWKFWLDNWIMGVWWMGLKVQEVLVTLWQVRSGQRLKIMNDFLTGTLVMCQVGRGNYPLKGTTGILWWFL